MRKALFVLFAWSWTGCIATTVQIPSEQRPALKRELEGTDRFLKLSMYATPFFGDATRKLLTAVPPEQVRLLVQPDGTPISPGPTEATFPVGTPVRIKQIEFPDGFTMAERVLMTPRTQVWVYLDVGGTPKNAPPYLVVLRQGLKTSDDLRGDLERYLTANDPKPVLEQMSESVREAVKAKNLLNDMPAEAVEMAWGFPETKKVSWENEKKKERWVWAGNQRFCELLDGRVTYFKP